MFGSTPRSGRFLKRGSIVGLRDIGRPATFATRALSSPHLQRLFHTAPASRASGGGRADLGRSPLSATSRSSDAVQWAGISDPGAGLNAGVEAGGSARGPGHVAARRGAAARGQRPGDRCRYHGPGRTGSRARPRRGLHGRAGPRELQTRDAGRRVGGVQVWTDHPAVSCMASRYAGWAIGVDKYFAMGSGPLRAHARVGGAVCKLERRALRARRVRCRDPNAPGETVAWVAGKAIFIAAHWWRAHLLNRWSCSHRPHPRNRTHKMDIGFDEQGDERNRHRALPRGEK